jgi:hypothetical protein
MLPGVVPPVVELLVAVVFAAIDVLVIVLIVREYRRVGRPAGPELTNPRWLVYRRGSPSTTRHEVTACQRTAGSRCGSAVTRTSSSAAIAAASALFSPAPGTRSGSSRSRAAVRAAGRHRPGHGCGAASPACPARTCPAGGRRRSAAARARRAYAAFGAGAVLDGWRAALVSGRSQPPMTARAGGGRRGGSGRGPSSTPGCGRRRRRRGRAHRRPSRPGPRPVRGSRVRRTG